VFVVTESLSVASLVMMAQIMDYLIIVIISVQV